MRVAPETQPALRKRIRALVKLAAANAGATRVSGNVNVFRLMRSHQPRRLSWVPAISQSGGAISHERCLRLTLVRGVRRTVRTHQHHQKSPTRRKRPPATSGTQTLVVNFGSMRYRDIPFRELTFRMVNLGQHFLASAAPRRHSLLMAPEPRISMQRSHSSTSIASFAKLSSASA